MSVFNFKKFSIIQSKSAMKVGTDGVLLGSWVNCEKANNILDIGSGTGLLALMLAQRNTSCIINAIEIDKDASDEAQLNIINSDWSNRISVQNIDIQSYKSNIKYDLIISNPPFYPSSFFNNKRIIARHTNLLSFDDLISSSVSLLSIKGLFAVVIPKNYELDFCQRARDNKLFILRVCNVKGRKNTDIKRVLLEFSFLESRVTNENLIVEESRHQYTKEYTDLCKDFYLKM